MIRFACRCGHRFELPTEEAGGVIQCRECGLLNDVPTLDDLPHLTEEGTYDISIERPVDDPRRLAQLGLIYGAGTRDVEGDEIDLRISMNELEGEVDAQTGVIPLAPIAPDKPTDQNSRPRYDPETGERVLPIEFKRPRNDPVDPAEIPVAKRAPALSYATVATDGIRPRRMLVDLLLPASLVVLVIIYVVQFVYQMLAIIPARVLWVFGVPPEVIFLPLLMLLLAHYANVVEDTGPFEHDEIQRPLRDFGIFDDILFPFTSALSALLLCYFPMILCARFTPPEVSILPLGILWIIGSYFYPAVLLTILTSGTYIDLLPARLFGMIRACGRQYWISFATWLSIGPLLYITVLGPRLPAMVVPQLMILGAPAVFIPLSMFTVYLAHFYHWHLGLLFRANSAKFPWVLQSLIMDRGRVRMPSEAQPAGAPADRARSTREKLKALRDAERKKLGEKTMVDQEVERTRGRSSWYT